MSNYPFLPVFMVTALTIGSCSTHLLSLNQSSAKESPRGKWQGLPLFRPTKKINIQQLQKLDLVSYGNKHYCFKVFLASISYYLLVIRRAAWQAKDLDQYYRAEESATAASGCTRCTRFGSSHLLRTILFGLGYCYRCMKLLPVLILPCSSCGPKGPVGNGIDRTL